MSIRPIFRRLNFWWSREGTNFDQSRFGPIQFWPIQVWPIQLWPIQFQICMHVWALRLSSMCTFGWSSRAVVFRPGGPKHQHLRVQTPPKFNEETHNERQKERKLCRERERAKFWAVRRREVHTNPHTPTDTHQHTHTPTHTHTNTNTPTQTHKHNTHTHTTTTHTNNTRNTQQHKQVKKQRTQNTNPHPNQP